MSIYCFCDLAGAAIAFQYSKYGKSVNCEYSVSERDWN
jgi:hypothetical protein